MSKVFLDTNVLVYAMDADAGEKQQTARRSLREVAGNAVVSTQVLQEFFVVATRKLGVAPAVAKSVFHALRRFETVTVTADLIEQAADCSMVHQLSFWDALIVVAAESARCPELWTEDLNPGQIIRGVKVVTPSG
ncbi:MAG: PIN domain-containing protein [Deferrisomatales bacterium]